MKKKGEKKKLEDEKIKDRENNHLLGQNAVTKKSNFCFYFLLREIFSSIKDF